MTELPIDAVLPELKRALATHVCAVLQAPPGAGKTTRVPLALLNEPWLQNQRIVMLEPRRLAARNAAGWMAELLGEEAGATIGYRTRMDTKVSARTRVEVVTEGVLARMLQSDAELPGVGLVIFDEFHERSIHTDLGLALCLDAQRNLRPELRVLVMSATLDAAPVARLLNDAPLITSSGRSYPVELRYVGAVPERERLATLARIVVQAVHDQPGSALVFLPGAGEIHKVGALLRAAALPNDVSVHALYGDLPRAAQEAAIQPCKPGLRKIVLATSIAETSLTIEGVRVVVDSGVMRVPRFEPRSGMSRLETVRVSRASADQRCGRAGRLEPGVCFRLWSESEHKALQPFTAPEIRDADLAPLVLELAQWGVHDAQQLSWLDPPPLAAQAQARELLRRLGALDEHERITPHGKAMAQLALHPRLAHMLLRAQEWKLGGVACDLAALLNERDVMKGAGSARDADVRSRLELLRRGAQGTGGSSFDSAALQRVMQASRQWQKHLRVEAAQAQDMHSAGMLLALAYPDRIAQRRGAEGYRYLLANGRGAFLQEGEGLAKAEYLAVADVDGGEREARIYLAAPLDERDLEQACGAQIETVEQVVWASREQAVTARRQRRYGELVLKDDPLQKPDPQKVLQALLHGVCELGVAALSWTPAARNWQARVSLLRRATGESAWPDVSDVALGAMLDHWLAPHVRGITRWSDVQRVDLMPALQELIDWKQRQALDDAAPTHITVPSGSRIALDYTHGDTPVLAVRLQELFGLSNTPRVANGRVPLLLHLLSPARHPVQVTGDLASFWKNSYQDVKKDLKGRYPKHYWPDDPLQAQPTARAKPRGK